MKHVPRRYRLTRQVLRMNPTQLQAEIHRTIGEDVVIPDDIAAQNEANNRSAARRYDAHDTEVAMRLGTFVGPMPDSKTA